MLRAEVMEVFLCNTNPHPGPGVWALKKKCREVDQELDYQFTHTNLTELKNNPPQVPDTKECS